MTELFSKPATGGIIEKIVDGEVLVLLQERCKGNDREDGLLEIGIVKDNDIVDLLIINMISMFEELEEQYKDYIKIK